MSWTLTFQIAGLMVLATVLAGALRDIWKK